MAMGAYFQDSWRLTNRLTANYGIRWDYFGVIGEQNNQFSLFNPATDALQQVGVNGGPSALYPKDWTNFAPRLSLADDLLGNGKLVVRTGVGIFYDGASQDFFVGNQPTGTRIRRKPARRSTTSVLRRTVAKTIVSGPADLQQLQREQRIYGFTESGYATVCLLQLQHRVAGDQRMAVQIGYVGSQGRHLFHFLDLNQVNNVAGSIDNCGNGKTVGYGSAMLLKFCLHQSD